MLSWLKLNCLLLASLGVLCGRLSAAELPVKMPNVLLIIADDFRESGGVFTKTPAKTPNLDRLAARGVRFANAFAQYPVCNPSRTSMRSRSPACAARAVTCRIRSARPRLAAKLTATLEDLRASPKQP